jgi:hypothetical protein
MRPGHSAREAPRSFERSGLQGAEEPETAPPPRRAKRWIAAQDGCIRRRRAAGLRRVGFLPQAKLGSDRERGSARPRERLSRDGPPRVARRLGPRPLRDSLLQRRAPLHAGTVSGSARRASPRGTRLQSRREGAEPHPSYRGPPPERPDRIRGGDRCRAVTA